MVFFPAKKKGPSINKEQQLFRQGFRSTHEFA